MGGFGVPTVDVEVRVHALRLIGCMARSVSRGVEDAVAVWLGRSELGMDGVCEMKGAGGLVGRGLGGNRGAVAGDGAGDERDEVDRVFLLRVGDLRGGLAMVAHCMFLRLQYEVSCCRVVEVDSHGVGVQSDWCFSLFVMREVVAERMQHEPELAVHAPFHFDPGCKNEAKSDVLGDGAPCRDEQRKIENEVLLTAVACCKCRAAGLRATR